VAGTANAVLGMIKRTFCAKISHWY